MPLKNIKAASNLYLISGILLTIAAGMAAFRFGDQILLRAGLLWPFAGLPLVFIPINIQIIFKFSEVRGLGRYSNDEQRRLRFIVDRRIKRIFFFSCYHLITGFVLILTSYLTTSPPLNSKVPYVISIAASMLTLSVVIFFLTAWALIEIDRFRAKLDERETADLERNHILSKLNQRNE